MALEEVGATRVLITGSGPTAVGLFEDVAADSAARRCRPVTRRDRFHAAAPRIIRRCDWAARRRGARSRIRLLVIIADLGRRLHRLPAARPSLDIEGWLEDVATDLGDLTYVFVGLLAFAETGAFVGLVFLARRR